MPPADPLTAEVVRLYGLPPEEFVAARNAAAKAARREKRSADATRIAALRKPSVVERAVNRTARADPATTTAWVRATRAVADAQSASIGGADATALRTAVRELRTATDAMVDAVVTTIDDGSRRDDVAALLRTLPVGALDQVAAGVLGSAIREDDELFAGAPDPPRRARSARPAAKNETRATTARTRSPRAKPPSPPADPGPTARERELEAAVGQRRSEHAEAEVARERAAAEVATARRRLETSEHAHASAEAAVTETANALAAAEADLEHERTSRPG